MPRGILSLPPVPPDEAHFPFITYRNYIDALLKIIRDRFGEDVEHLHNEITSQPRFPRLLRSNVDVAEVRRHLRSAWSTELIMAAFPQTSLGEAIRYANVWVPVQAYYAIFAGLLAWMGASGQTVRSHKAALDKMGQEMSSRSWLCVPWSVVCEGCPQTSSEQFKRLDPIADLTISNLSGQRDPAAIWGLFAKCLETTRRDVVEEAFEAWKGDKRNFSQSGKRRKALRRSEKEKIAANVAPTSLFRFFYRMRIRSNYRDTDAFALGAWTVQDAMHFYESVVQLTAYTLRFVEILVTGRMGSAQFLGILREFVNDSPVRAQEIPPVRYWLNAGGVRWLEGR